MEIRAELGPAENGDFPIVPSMISKDIDNDIKPLARRIPADGSGAKGDGGKVFGLVFSQYLFTLGLKVGVVGEGLEGHVLMDVGFLLDSVDA